MEILNTIFNTANYPARWHCGSWSAFWGWLHIYSDLFIFLAYMGIPIVLLAFKKQLNHFKVNSVLVLFACFIAFCGLTHLNEAIIFWYPFYNYAGLIKFCTAVVSVCTLIVIYLKFPEIIELLNEKRSSKVLNEIINSCPQGILIVNHMGEMVFANKLIPNLFGFDPSDLIGKNVETLIPNDHRERHVNLRKLYLKSPTKRQMGGNRDLFALKKNGQKFPVEIGLSPIKFEGETCVLCSIVDITERKAREVELNQLNVALERSNAELEEFTYIASHDLKEPLRGIHNYSIMLMENIEQQLAEEDKARLAKLPHLTKRLEQQIDSLLEYSRLGKTELSLGKVDLIKLVNEVDDLLELTKAQKEVEIVIQPDLPIVYGNYVNLLVVFNNLISNALKYNDNKNCKIEVGTFVASNEHNFCTIYVRDNGIGIDPKHLDQIFTIFKRLHPRNYYGGGSGIGLTIVKKIIEIHGGEIWVESEKEKGTTFFMSLPLYQAEELPQSDVS